MTGPVLSAIQLRRAIENAGGLWNAGDLAEIGAMRPDDRDLPPGIYIDKITFRTGHDMRAYAEKLGRAHSAEKMDEAITKRQGQIAERYAKKEKAGPSGGGRRRTGKRENVYRRHL